MGWGDSAFALSLGWFLGLDGAFTALALAVWSGAFIGLALIGVSQLSWKSRTGRFTMSSEVPFAPFLALGACVVYFFHVTFFSSFSLLF